MQHASQIHIDKCAICAAALPCEAGHDSTQPAPVCDELAAAAASSHTLAELNLQNRGRAAIPPVLLGQIHLRSIFTVRYLRCLAAMKACHHSIQPAPVCDELPAATACSATLAELILQN